jgi:hypothetical protein
MFLVLIATFQLLVSCGGADTLSISVATDFISFMLASALAAYQQFGAEMANQRGSQAERTR